MARQVWYSDDGEGASVSVVHQPFYGGARALVSIYNGDGTHHHWRYADKTVVRLAYLADDEITYEQAIALIIAATSNPPHKAWLTRRGYTRRAFPVNDQRPKCPLCWQPVHDPAAALCAKCRKR